MDEKLRIVKPCGFLYTKNETYYLLSPEPIVKDSWQGDNCYRFSVVPLEVKEYEQKGTDAYPIYGFARQIVTNSFTIEYIYNLEEIHVPISNELDLTQPEYPIEEDKNDNEENYPF
jgi:hypothetical protein